MIETKILTPSLESFVDLPVLNITFHFATISLPVIRDAVNSRHPVRPKSAIKSSPVSVESKYLRQLLDIGVGLDTMERFYERESDGDVCVSSKLLIAPWKDNLLNDVTSRLDQVVRDELSLDYFLWQNTSGQQ